MGVFLRSIIIRNSRERIERVQHLWMSHNITKDGLNAFIKELDVTKHKRILPEEDKQIIGENWRKLAFFMVGKK